MSTKPLKSSSKIEVERVAELFHDSLMPKPYGQYCPIALATEILGERWTILVVMALADGVDRFSDLQRALPRISASTLTNRLRTLEDAGVLYRVTLNENVGSTYHLTLAGEELGQIVYSLGTWGQRWGRDLETNDLDPHHLMWSIHLRLNLDIMPDGRTTIGFVFTDVPVDKRYFWIVVNGATVDACLKNPGFEEDLVIRSSIQSFVDAWRGFSSLREEINCGRISVMGPKKLVKAFPDWLLLSMLASEERMRDGRERKKQQLKPAS